MKYIKASMKEQKKWRERFGTSFRAGSCVYRIIWCHSIQLSDRACYGVCNVEDKIVLVDIMHKDVQETLIHEMMHAEFHECGMSQMDALYSDLEELCCEAASRVARNFELKRKNGRKNKAR